VLRLWQFGIGVDNFDVADMVVVVVAAAVDGRMSWNLNGETVEYGLMIVEKTIGLSAIDDCDIGKDVDVDEEGTCRRTPMVVVVVVTQQHRGEDHHKEVVPRYKYHEEEGIAVVCLSYDRRILFLCHEQAVAGYGSMNVEEMIDILVVT